MSNRESLLSKSQKYSGLSINEQTLDSDLLSSQIDKSEKIDGKNCWQQMVFGWSYSLISKSKLKTVSSQEYPSLKEQHKSLTIFHKFLQLWNENKAEGKQNLLLGVILKANKPQVIKLLFFGICVYSMYLSFPLLLYYDIDYIQNSKKDTQLGIILFLLTIIHQLFYGFSYAHLKYQQAFFGINLVSTINLMVFNKALRYPIISSKRYSEAAIINYSQIDAANLKNMATVFGFFAFGIIEIGVGLLLFYLFIGIQFFIVIGIMVVINLISYKIGKETIYYNMQILETKDKRINTTEEMLRIIKNIKTNAQEKYFYTKINAIRETEIGHYRMQGILQGLMNFLYYLTAPLILAAVFLTQQMTGQEITAAKIFVVMSITHIFEDTAHSLPNSIAEIISIFNSLRRIQNFLLAAQIQHKNENQEQRKDDGVAISISNGNFFVQAVRQIEQEEQQEYEKESQKVAVDAAEAVEQEVCLLKDIDLRVEKGKFYMIFGDIGAGKSTLLLSLLNELRKGSDSQVRVSGRLAYVSQRSWIMQESLEDNVCFAFPKDEHKLRQVFESSCLLDDIKMLPEGARTAIGENGINLSGGQKARIAFARALYSDSDVLLFDDVLSAVDVHVGEFLLAESIKKRLRDKTVVMVTHAIKFAHFADVIILMKDGRIVAQGDFETVSKNPQFSELLDKINQQSKQKNKDQQEDLIDEQSKKQQEIKQIKIRKQSLQMQKDEIVQQFMIEQDRQTAKLNSQILLRYIELNGGFWSFAFVVFMSYAIYSALQTFGSIFIERWSDSNGSQSTYLYLYMGLTLGSVFCVLLQIYILLISNLMQGRSVHNTIIKRLLYSSYTNFFNRVPMGRIINRLSKDIKDLDEVIGVSLGYCLLYFVQIISGLILVVYSTTFYALIPVFIAVVASYLLRRYYVLALHQASRLEKITNSPIVSGFTTAVNGLITIRAFKKENHFLERQAALLDENKKMALNKYGLQAWFELTLVCLIFVLNTFCIGFAMFSSSTTSSTFGLLLYSILSVNELIYSLFLEFTNFEANLICLQRLYHFMKLPVQPAYEEYCRNWSQEEEELSPQIKSGRIEFRHTYLRYRDDLPNIVKDLTLTINAGEKVGIIGRTGSGKSTIINALIRITQVSQGSILIDGVSIKDMFIKNLRSEVTVIDQEPILIEASFRENLDMLHRYSDRELVDILQECNLLDIVTAKGGLDGKADQNSLSAGEKQLLCICRAFLKNSKVILIDQATANIDTRNDALIQQVIANRFREKTVLTIAHRLTTLDSYDKILVLDQGRAAEYGPPSELLRQKGLYFQMIESYKAKKRA